VATRLDPDERRRQILDCASRLFSERHYGSVSLDRVAEAAGITRGLLHHYFGTKRELYLAVVADLAATLPDGLATQLGKSYTDGHELSGGQWQRLALGRAFMRVDPLLAVLDEPTAAIDAPTEHALFERYAAAARSGANRGTVTLLISHRFSTVRMADVILVLADGQVTEQGSHDELMRRGGLYAELYGLQAAAYQ
jgi:ATP-binding cassette subfamily B protein